MSITNYGELKTAVGNWIARSDLTSVIPDFITLAENKIHYGDETIGMAPLRVQDMVTDATVTLTSGSGSLPSDFLQVQQLRVPTSTPRPLEYIDPGSFWNSPVILSSDEASQYTIQGTTIRTRPTGSSSLTLSYYQKLAALSDNADTNWLLDDNPSIYLFGAVAEAWAYVMNAEKAALMMQRFAGAVNSMQRSDTNALAPEGGLIMRPQNVS